MDHLLYFYGEECHFCKLMHPLVERLEKELGSTLTKFETWHHPENAAKLSEYDKGYCGGVPFFYNTATQHWICGATEYTDLKNWAQGK